MFTTNLEGLPVPLLPVQILLVNLVTDGLSALALGVDPINPDVMTRPPRKSTEAVITKKRVIYIVAQGFFIAFCSLLAFVFVLYVEKESLARARTAAFAVLVVSQTFHSFNCRSMTESIFKLGIFTNKKLVLAGFISFLIMMIAVFVPSLQTVFKTVPLGVYDLLLVLLISSFPLWAVEIWKVVLKKRKTNT
jgi:Ca2+-transporting ATPase